LKLPAHLIPRGMKVVLVNPGEYYASREPLIIQTLLGSCVSACLYDREAQVGGLNHFLLASPKYLKSSTLITSDAGRYGIHAMELLINDLMKKGAKRTSLRAKVFGGASVLGFSGDDFFKVPELNQRFILEFLETERIPMEAGDLGGTRGRVIYFNTKNLEVTLRYIADGKTKEVEKDERTYWLKKTREPDSSQIFLF